MMRYARRHGPSSSMSSRHGDRIGHSVRPVALLRSGEAMRRHRGVYRGPGMVKAFWHWRNYRQKPCLYIPVMVISTTFQKVPTC